ncbi:hypothetical protein [uncultured Desulfovibrio sp.]|nr:hypothetical protein [uncultured Desulfovibrio sp.]
MSLKLARIAAGVKREWRQPWARHSLPLPPAAIWLTLWHTRKGATCIFW